MLIGLTGERYVGKSEIIKHVVAKHNYVQAHSFGPGKVMLEAYLIHRRIPGNIVTRMLHGDLKDTPSLYLPDNVTPRYLMEKTGYFMGVELGPEWTLGVELDRFAEDGYTNIIIDSVVYEESLFRAKGGVIIRVIRPGESNKHIDAPNTNAFQKHIKEHISLYNDATLEHLQYKVNHVLELLNNPEYLKNILRGDDTLVI